MTRIQEYLLLLAAGMIGGGFGAANNALISSRVSPHYFTIGKGLPVDEAVKVGFQAGFGAALLGTAVLLYLRRVGLADLARPLLCAAMAGPFVGVAFGSWDPLGFGDDLIPRIGPAATAAFLRVWWLHVGLYAGATAGFVRVGYSKSV